MICEGGQEIQDDLDLDVQVYNYGANDMNDDPEGDWVQQSDKPKLVNAKKKESSKQAAARGHGGCGRRQPQIRTEGLRLVAVMKTATSGGGALEGTEGSGRVTLTAEKALRILEKISDADMVSMGFSPLYSRPAWFILTVLAVPPPPVRPGILMDEVSRGEDDLTHKLGDILRASQALQRHGQDGSPAHIVNEFEQLLQFHVATYLDNELPGQPQAIQKSGRPLKSLRARLKGKEGRLRGNLMGKRVDFSARTVISPDPNLGLDELGVPKSIALTLTIPERVTSYNIAALTRLVRNGPKQHPGARFVIRPDGQRIDLRFARLSDVPLPIGSVVERHLSDGDVVLFNRQPSLHKMSMMAHRVRVMPFSTFRLNLSVTTPYNADFDGDEMNMHVPQSVTGKAELVELCLVPRQIISPQSNKPVMGIVQDSLCGVRKLTRRDVFLSSSDVMRLAMWLPGWDGKLPEPALLKPTRRWTGKQMVSLLLPRALHLTAFHAAHPDEETTFASPGDTRVLIRDGLLIAGILCKRTVGTASGGLIHVLVNEHGTEAAKHFLNGLQSLVNAWLLQHGFSIGIGDTVADAATMATITDTIQSAKARVHAVILQAQKGALPCQPGMTLSETFEHVVAKELNRARDNSGTSAQQSLREQNNVKQMVLAGSKGTFINISQMTACVGQQSVEGRRIPFGFRHRTLPHFTKDDNGPESRGFVENSYLRGLTPQEFFFHAMGGREGLIDTAVKTAETGYIQRRLVKALEDVGVQYDGTVRNAVGDILQFAYGDDGMDATFLEKQPLDYIALSDLQWRERFHLDLDAIPLANHDVSFTASSSYPSIDMLQLQRALDTEEKALWMDRLALRSNSALMASADYASRPFPVHLPRLLAKAKLLFPTAAHSEIFTTRTVQDTLVKVDSLLSKLYHAQQTPQTKIMENGALVNGPLMDASLFVMHVRACLSVKRILVAHGLSQPALDWLIGEIEARYWRACVAPGEMVGTLAAQSIGEPATQMTLNTFHLAGVSHNLTHGVPRLKEIINVATHMKTPSLTVHLLPHVAASMAKAKAVQVDLEHTTLRHIAAATEIHYDPEPSETIISEDRDFVAAYYALPDDELAPGQRLSPWLLRIELDRASMLDKKLTMADVAAKIIADYNRAIHVIHNDDNAPKLILRCRIVHASGTSGKQEADGGQVEEDEEDEGTGIQEDVFLKRIESSMLSSVTLRGISGISRVFMVEGKRLQARADGALDSRQAEWLLETQGIHLAAVLAHPDVDPTRTTSNAVLEIYQVLGIEAARASLLKELRGVIESDGSYVNYRHLALLADIMTRRGFLTGVTRHGTNRVDNGALMRCSFEETVEILLDAAAIAELNGTDSVSEAIMLGQLAPLGTGDVQLLLNEALLEKVPVFPMLAAANRPMYPSAAFTAFGAMTPGAQSPFYDPQTPRYNPFAQTAYGYGAAGAFTPYMANPMDLAFSPLSDSGNIPFSPYTMPLYHNQQQQHQPYPFTPKSMVDGGSYSPTSPAYSPTSPAYSPTSPAYSPTSPAYSPTSPAYSPTSPAYSPTSPAYSPTSPAYSPTSPAYSPTSPAYSPTSPAYSPTSPAYSPTSPAYSPTSPAYSPTSPAYSPTSPAYSPTSPAYSPTSPAYSPTSPAYSPATQHRQ
jgi:DNA-directed RNA polymerase II subunit RPB1